MKLQNKYGLEKYIRASYNQFFGPEEVMPITKLAEVYADGDNNTELKGIDTISFFISEFNKKYFKTKIGYESITRELLRDYCLISTTIEIEIVDTAGWSTDPLYFEYSKYKNNIIAADKFPPVVFIAPSTLCSSTDMYSLDGMHRIMSTLEAGLTEIQALIVVPRKDLYKYLSDVDLISIEEAANTCTWFPRYQEIKEVNLSGQRKQSPRYDSIYNFSFLRDKTVVDLGCNIGQAPLEAFFHGAKKVYGYEYQDEAVATANKIKDVFNTNVLEFDTIDFNNWNTMHKVEKLVSCDWIIFQAIYRTKEIEDIEKVMEFVYNFVTEGIIFEGNADPRLDTFEFYNEKVFKKYNLKYEYLGHSEHRPVWILRK